MKYIKKGHIVVCDNCGAHVLIESKKKDTFMSYNWNHTKYLRYITCPCCGNDVYAEYPEDDKD